VQLHAMAMLQTRSGANRAAGKPRMALRLCGLRRYAAVCPIAADYVLECCIPHTGDYSLAPPVCLSLAPTGLDSDEFSCRRNIVRTI
jgi:hypothetical protein